MSGWFPAPAAAKERRVTTGRLTMNIVEAGNGPPVLFIHGLGWDHSLWNPTVERLAPHYRVVAVDTRGHGATDKPDGPYDMAMFARDTAALVDALGLTDICVIGLSQGGMVAQNLALLRPDLVSSLMLISTSCKSAPSLRDNMEARIAAMEKVGPEAAAGIAAREHLSPRLARRQPRRALARFVSWRSEMPSDAAYTAATRALYEFNPVERSAADRCADPGGGGTGGHADAATGHGRDRGADSRRGIQAHPEVRSTRFRWNSRNNWM